MSRRKSIVTMVLVTILGLGLWLATGPLGIALAGVIGLALTFGFYWSSIDSRHLLWAASRSLADRDDVAAQIEPDAGLPKHWGWRALSGGLAALLIVLGFALAG